MRVVRVLAAAIVAVVGLSQPSAAAVITLSGNYSNASVTIPLTLGSSGLVDFQTAEATLFDDPVISLFDSAGNHIVTVDDEYTPALTFFSLQAHLTQNLAAGDYFVLLTEFPIVLPTINAGTPSTASTDGFNFGTFWFGGSATLSQAVSDVATAGQNSPFYLERPYHLTITTEADVAPVPEPTSILLVGSGLALAQMRRARRRKS